MSLIKKNVIANSIGSGLVALVSFAFIPVYIHFLGIEAYGLVGFYMTLQAVLFFLDLGLTATVSRELSRLSIDLDAGDRMRTLVRTLEIVYWCVSLFILAITVMLSDWIANEWLQSGALSKEELANAVILMGLVIAVRMPFGFYSGGLLGLQHQVLMNILKVGVETVRNGGAAIILWLVSPTISAFFMWQGAVGLVGTLVVGLCLWWQLPPSHVKPAFNMVVLKQLWRFAAGMSGIVLVSIMLMQMDKILLSKLLTLEQFGYYTLASVISMALFFLVNPVVAAYSPRLTQLVAAGNEEELVLRYHQGCQLISVVTFPVALTISAFSFEVLLLWTQDRIIADQTHAILSVLMIGSLLNATMNLPYALQIAFAWTKLTLILNLTLLVLLFPLLIFLTQQFGVVGAAFVWLVLNLISVLVGIPLMHNRLIKAEKWTWFSRDFCFPLIAALLVVGLGRFIVIGSNDAVPLLLTLLAVFLLSSFAAALAASFVRGHIFAFIKRIRLL